VFILHTQRKGAVAMRVLKFGGSSVATPERIRVVSKIILDTAQQEPVIIVVSAFQGVSSQLLACAQMSAAGDKHYQTIYEQIAQRHIETIQVLLPENSKTITAVIEQLLLELNEILQGIFLLNELTLGALDHIAGFGERLSANIVAAFLAEHHPAEYVDARKIIFTDDFHTQANVDFEKTIVAIQQYVADNQSRQPSIPIVTGFIGCSTTGRTTTLGRNSSDYSATIIGAAIDATCVEIWTDVDGIYSADPQFVPSAFIIPHLSFEEAIELSYFGAKVLHPSTFIPVLEKQIPILIKNTTNASYPGTLISQEYNGDKIKKGLAKSISAIEDITLLKWQGNGMLDVAATMERLFRCLTAANVNIFLVLEGSPKHTFCLAISNKDIEIARKAIHREFNLEFKHQLINLEEKTSQTIIAIIGDEMKQLSPEIAGKMFQALGRFQIQINAIVQGASERNLSIVIDSQHRVRALNLIHQAFFSETKCLTLIVIGAGRVGKAFLKHLYQQRTALHDKKINISVCAITNSKNMIISAQGINPENWESELKQSTEVLDIPTILKLLAHMECSNIALVDCTASDATVAVYSQFIEKGIHIITPNKRANVLPYKQWKKMMASFTKHQCHFLCRTNVGAGLPILTVLDDLIACGDTIYKIEGIISGTLSYIFNRYDGTLSFGEVVRQAQELGMTEPDPREDLSGIDVARKLLILARKMGWPMSLEDVSVQNLIPEALQSGTFTNAFYAELDKHEESIKERVLRCKNEGKVLRYIGSLHNGKATTQLQEIPIDHPLALSTHSDNIIAFTSFHYHEAPLVIRGPGAGVECTALGVFSDLLKLISYLPD
jgi:aspartokinase/homoserine dehydrogenase 1